MPQAVGVLILAGLEEAGVSGAAVFGTFSIGVTGITGASIVGSAAILGATIGLSLAFAPTAATPADGSTPLKQSIPPRIRGYGRGRVAGYYMLFEQFDSAAYTLCAFHQGRISEIVGYYLDNDPVTVVGNVVQDTYSDHRYSDGFVQFFSGIGDGTTVVHYFGDVNAEDFLFDPNDHQPHEIAWFSMRCGGASNPQDFTKYFPHNLPSPSVVADLSPIWDPRDPTQSRTDSTTWKLSRNPVIQLLDFHLCADGGMGMDFDDLFPPDRLAQWMAEAQLCDELVLKSDGTMEPRYQSNGWYTFDTKPSDVIGFILATCDGWLADAGDGTQALTVGVYRAPTKTPITEKQILAFSLSYGQADEDTTNVLNPSYVEPALNYVQVQTTTVIDQDAVSLTGQEQSKPLDLTWVQSNNQVNRLAARALQRLNPPLSGSFVTDLTGLQYIEDRWIPVQYPFVSGLQDSILENLGASVDWTSGRVTFKFNLIDPLKIEAFDPASVVYTPPIPTKPQFQRQLDFSTTLASQYVPVFF